MPRRVWTEAMTRRLRHHLAEGTPYAEVARDLGLRNISQVRMKVFVLRLTPRPRTHTWSAEDSELVADLAGLGHSAGFIRRALRVRGVEVTERQIRARLSHLGISIKAAVRASPAAQERRKAAGLAKSLAWYERRQAERRAAAAPKAAARAEAKAKAKAELTELVLAAVPYRTIAARLGVSTAVVQKRVSALGLSQEVRRAARADRREKERAREKT